MTLVTFGILAAGLFVVVGGILFLRLHAFVALILAALLVAALTSRDAIIRSQVVATSVLIRPVDGDPQMVRASRELNTKIDWVTLPETGSAAAEHGPQKLRLEALPAAAPAVAEQEPASPRESAAGTHSDSGPLYRLVMADGPSKSPAGLPGEEMRLVTAAEYAGAVKSAGRPAVLRVSESLGTSCGRLAILIIAAAIIGECLLQSGAADRVVQSALAVFGQSGSPVAFAGSGFLLAIPVFFDTVFLLMVPLARSLYQRTKVDYLLYILSIVAGATMAHSLVPPTPGPLLIAEAFQVPLSAMILGGSVVGVIAASAGLAYAYLLNRRGVLIPPDLADLISPQSAPAATDGCEERRVPSLAESLLPVLLPVALMTLETRYDSAQGQWDLGPIHLPAMVGQVLAALCEKNMALIVGAVCSVWTLVRFRQPLSSRRFWSLRQSARLRVQRPWR